MEQQEMSIVDLKGTCQLKTGEESDEEFCSDDDTGDDIAGHDTTADTAASKMSSEDRWMQRYNELKLFNKVNGNCNVSNKSSDHPALRNWVKNQRQQYRKGLLSDDRTQLLAKLGFIWSLKDNNEVLWNQRLVELKQFKSANGNCNVTTGSSDHPALGNWIKYQRQQNRKGLLSDDRMRLLTELGFVWSSKKDKDALQQC